jgi:hypothetical protein
MQLQAAGAIKAINAASHATYKVPRSPARSTIGRSLQFLKQSWLRCGAPTVRSGMGALLMYGCSNVRKLYLFCKFTSLLAGALQTGHVPRASYSWWWWWYSYPDPSPSAIFRRSLSLSLCLFRLNHYIQTKLEPRHACGKCLMFCSATSLVRGF